MDAEAGDIDRQTGDTIAEAQAGTAQTGNINTSGGAANTADNRLVAQDNRLDEECNHLVV